MISSTLGVPHASHRVFVVRGVVKDDVILGDVCRHFDEPRRRRG